MLAASHPYLRSLGVSHLYSILGPPADAFPVIERLRPVHQRQTAVNKFTGGFDSGGGFSTIFPAEDYQAAHTKKYVDTEAAPPAGIFDKANRYIMRRLEGVGDIYRCCCYYYRVVVVVVAVVVVAVHHWCFIVVMLCGFCYTRLRDGERTHASAARPERIALLR